MIDEHVDIDTSGEWECVWCRKAAECVNIHCLCAEELRFLLRESAGRLAVTGALACDCSLSLARSVVA